MFIMYDGRGFIKRGGDADCGADVTAHPNEIKTMFKVLSRKTVGQVSGQQAASCSLCMQFKTCLNKPSNVAR